MITPNFTASSPPGLQPDFTRERLPGYYVGPDGAWLTLPWPKDLSELPKSLGPGVIHWAETHLVHHLTGKPWRYTIGQKKFLHLWYAVDEDGRWLWTSGVKRGAKGTGKDPMLATMLLAEAWGPTQFDGFDNDGNPVGITRRSSLVQIGANSESQAADVLRVANIMLPEDTKYEYGIDTGIHRTQCRNFSRIELMTASERSAEGDPVTAGFLNETHHMTESNGGHRISAVARRNVGKSPIYVGARLCEFTNAHMQGQDSVAERSFMAWQAQQAGKTRRQTILYDSREADPATDMTDETSLMKGLSQSYGDSPWTDVERIRDEVQDLRTPVADSVRYYLNGLAAAEDAWVDPAKFDALARAEFVLEPREQIAMFLDCSKVHDCTALVASRISDGHVFTLGVWGKPHGARDTWRIPRAEVDDAVRKAFAQYRPVWFGVDPSSAVDDENEEVLYWASEIDGWHRDFRDKVKLWASPGTVRGSAVLYDMRMSSYGGAQRNKLLTEMAMRCAREIDVEGILTHDGHQMLRRHAHNARRRPNDWGISLGKVHKDSTHHVDAAFAMVGARLGRKLALDSGKVKSNRGKASF